MKNVDSQFDLVIVGAGFSGLYMLVRARELGLSAKVFEAGDNVGGTWYWNRYPGARCDIESMEYSYEFSDELQQDWVWPERFSAQPDILDYLNHVADRFDLRRDIQFNTRIASASYDESANLWHIESEDGEQCSARFFIAATGCLSAPLKPNFTGLEDFDGEIYHTGLWPHEDVDFSGKRVAVIGTGSSAIQCIPEIAKQAAQLTVYQRTPAYAAPAQNRPLTDEERAAVKSKYREVRSGEKASFFAAGALYPFNETPMAEHSAQQCREQLEKGWELGGLLYLFSYPDALLNPETNRVMADFIREKIAERVDDPVTAARLMPEGYVGAKRLCTEIGYYETFNRDNVSLIDVRETPIECLSENGIVTSAGEEQYDAIVFATGFDAMTGALTRMDIRGREGASLKEKWQQQASTYMGLQVAGFPNLFLLAAGPGSSAVLTNVVQSIEAHVNWVSDCLGHMQQQGLDIIEASEQAEAGWVDHVNEVANMTLLAEADSWYTGANVPGKKKLFMPYVAGFPAYWQACKDAAEDNYRGFILSRTDT